MDNSLQRRLEAARAARQRTAEAAFGPDPSNPAEAEDVGSDTGEAPTEAQVIVEGDHDSVVIDLRTVRSVRAAAERARTLADGVNDPDDADPADFGLGAGTGWAVASLSAYTRAAQRTEPASVVTTTSPAQERCPNCGGSVRIDLFDLVASVAHLTCLDCGFLFTARSPHGMDEPDA